MRKTKQVTFTLTPETIERLEIYSAERHSSKSKAITDMIWNAQLEEELSNGKNKKYRKSKQV